VAQELFTRTGCINIGEPGFSAARDAAQQHGLPHQVLTGRQAMQHFPGVLLLSLLLLSLLLLSLLLLLVLWMRAPCVAQGR
jgi:hypothetical protein